MMFGVFEIDIKDIIPGQHYLSELKYSKIQETLKDIPLEEVGDIYVIKYKDKVFSIDGHHRLFYLFKQGVQKVTVINEFIDNDSKLYKRLADESIQLGIKHIGDLETRMIKDHNEFVMKWVDKCQLYLLEETDKIRYLMNPCRTSALPLHKELRVNLKDTVVIHEDDLQLKQLNQFERHDTYFRLIHHLESVECIQKEGYIYQQVQMNEEVYEVVDFIHTCYKDIHITKEKLISMTKDRVYDETLWVWLIEKQTGKKVALGIANYDTIIEELELDWIQVKPDYIKNGFGRMIVTYLVSNAPYNTRFATVSGKYSETLIEFYHSCGFEGRDTWHILRGKKDE